MRLVSCIVLILWSASAMAQATVYRWVDEDGVVHYSDRPREGAEEIHLGRPPGFATPALPAAPRALVPALTADPAPAYETLAIVQPGKEETLWNIGGLLNISVQVRPALHSGHRVQLLYDGQALEPLPPGVTSVELTDVGRGEHTLMATIIDAERRVLAESPAVTFFVQQTSILRP